MKQKTQTGELSVHKDGYGFVNDIFIPARYIENALHRDTVLVSEIEGRGGKSEGRILQIIKHGLTQIVGRFERLGREFVVVAEDARVQHTVKIAPGKLNGAKEGETVLVELLSYPADKQGLTGIVKKIFGTRGFEKVELDIVVAKHGLPLEFPKDVLHAADKICSDFAKEKPDSRDLKNIPFVTIDGETAKDFDDAISVEQLGNSVIKLYVSIADVSYFVKENSLIDKEAFSRSTSVYFPGWCIPMLPHQLSDDLCSLRPDEDRLTLTAEMDFDQSGKMIKSKFYRSIIRSRARMTYTEVRDILAPCHPREETVSQCRGGALSPPNNAIECTLWPAQRPATTLRHSLEDGNDMRSGIISMLKLAEELYGRINQRRVARGSIDFDLPEPQIVLDLEGGADSIVKSERNVAHRLIEEFMVAANEAVAEELTKRKSGCVYRIHEQPNEEKLRALFELLHNLTYNIKLKLPVQPKVLAGIVKMVSGKPEERLVNSMLLRSMAQAVYSTENVGHFGLASKCYCHFTSPIRRYPDLVVHRLLTKTRLGGKSLDDISTNSSQRERKAMEAERETVSLYVAFFMRDRIGQTFDGIISHVTKFGFFVELSDFFIEGLVRADTLKEDRYKLDGHMLIGQKHRTVYKIGDKVRVEVADVSVEQREVNFTLV